MPYAIRYTNKKTGRQSIGPTLRKRTGKTFRPPLYRYRNLKEALKICDRANEEFTEAYHSVVKIKPGV